MTRPVQFHLSSSQLAAIDDLLTQTDQGGIRKRAEALRLLHHHQSVTQVARIMGVGRRSVLNWVYRYRAEGLDGLITKSRSGRPTVTDEAYCQALGAALSHSPGALGYQSVTWTVALLGWHLQTAPGRRPGNSTIRDLLHSLGYAYTHQAPHDPRKGWTKTPAMVAGTGDHVSH